MDRKILSEVEEKLKGQLSEIRSEFEKTKKEKNCLWKQYRNVTNKRKREKLEDLNKKLDKEYYELLNAIEKIPTILSIIANIITGKYVNPYDLYK